MHRSDDEASLAVAARICGLTAAAIGVVVLAGWAMGLPFLIRLVPGAVAMVPNTAIAFVLAGIALILVARDRQPRTVRILAAIAAALALADALEYLLHVDLGID
ncbi:MAG TPA: hypothetical protein VEZ11_03240, partial [Thermoanaerobaculia bacterium]|nr:hypothetical protein [Thermoanaerobaculia bacterium]